MAGPDRDWTVALQFLLNGRRPDNRPVRIAQSFARNP